ncbi:MAG: aromatic amino acid lyase [Luteimonas sp.]
MKPILLDGASLSRAQLVAVANGATVALDKTALQAVARAADFLAAQVASGEPLYGISTGFGSNADKLLPADGRLRDQLQHNLIVTHAVCVGEPFAAEVVRAMLCIRINTLLRGHSGIRVSTLHALAAMLNAGVVPVVPQLGSVGASGDLAPLSHLAIVLLGGGEAFFDGERMPGAAALQRAGLAPVTLGLKEGLALNNGTAQMLATGVLALAKLEDLLDTADLAAAMTIDAFAGRVGAFAPEVHALRPHPGQVHVAARLRALLDGSTLADIDYHLVPKSCPGDAGADMGWEWVPSGLRAEREAFFARFLPFRGGKKMQPQDSYSLRCVPQVHGAVRDAVAHAARVLEIELNSVTDNPLVFPDAGAGQAVISAGHFHGMPLALAMSYVKAAIPVLASISERRLNKLVDPATNDGMPAFLVGNDDGTESGLMIVQYTAAAIVNDLASRAMPASVYSIPTSANAEDHVSMGANEARHVLAMTDDLGKVLGLELFVAAQALDVRLRMLEAARSLAADAKALATKVSGQPAADAAAYATFLTEVGALCTDLRDTSGFHPGRAVAAAHAVIRERIDFLEHDRALDGDVGAAVRMVVDGNVLAAARAAM